jgi:hypothetical protein
MTSMNPVEVLIKSIASLWAKLTKKVALGLMFSIVRFYDIEYKSKSDGWIDLKLYQVIPEVFYVKANFRLIEVR